MVDTKALIRKLDTLYGKGNGAKVCMTILPPVLSDFQKLLAASRPGGIVRETYRLDDGQGVLTLSGSRTTSGRCDITADLEQDTRI